MDAGLDTVLSVHSGGPGTQANQLAVNDDAPFGYDPACGGADEGLRRDSALTLEVTVGETLLIRVSRYSETTNGAFTLFFEPPAGAMCGDGMVTPPRFATQRQPRLRDRPDMQRDVLCLRGGAPVRGRRGDSPRGLRHERQRRLRGRSELQRGVLCVHGDRSAQRRMAECDSADFRNHPGDARRRHERRQLERGRRRPARRYWFDATATGTVRLNTCGTNDTGGVDAGLDTVLSVHFAGPGTVANELAANDDAQFGYDPACGGADEGLQRDSALTLQVTVGETLLIRVSRFDESTNGAFTLVPCSSWERHVRGRRGDCTRGVRHERQRRLPGRPDVQRDLLGVHGGCSAERRLAECGCADRRNHPGHPGGSDERWRLDQRPPGQPDVWYSFDATATGTIGLSTCGTNDMGGVDAGLDSVLSIHSEGPGTRDNELALNDDFQVGNDPNACTGVDLGVLRDSALTFQVEAGQSILIRVSRYDETTNGAFSLILETSVSGPVCGDGVVNGNEACDTTGNLGCPAGESCNATCTGCGVACGNGICEIDVIGETDTTCPADCGCTAGLSCGGAAPSGCFCDEACSNFGDCCGDVCAACRPCRSARPTTGMATEFPTTRTTAPTSPIPARATSTSTVSETSVTPSLSAPWRSNAALIN